MCLPDNISLKTQQHPSIYLSVWVQGNIFTYVVELIKSALLILLWIASSEFWIQILKHLGHNFFLPSLKHTELSHRFNSSRLSWVRKYLHFIKCIASNLKSKHLKWPVSAFLRVWSNFFNKIFVFWETLSHSIKRSHFGEPELC